MGNNTPDLSFFCLTLDAIVETQSADPLCLAIIAAGFLAAVSASHWMVAIGSSGPSSLATGGHPIPVQWGLGTLIFDSTLR